jgi:hypothetical protein
MPQMSSNSYELASTMWNAESLKNDIVTEVSSSDGVRS